MSPLRNQPPGQRRRRGRVRPVPVAAAHDRRAAQRDLAVVPDRHRDAVGVDDPDLDRRGGPADRARVREVARTRVRRRDRRGLGQPVRGRQRVADLRERDPDPLDELGRRGRAAVPDAADRRQVVAPEGLRLDDAPHDRGHAADARHLLPLDGRHRRVGIELARRHQHELRARRVTRGPSSRARRSRGTAGRRAGTRSGGRHAAPAAPCVGSDRAEAREVLQVGERLAVRDRRALRASGRARRVEDREQVVLARPRRRAACPGRPRRAARGPAAPAPSGSVEVHHEDVLEVVEGLHDVAHDVPALRVAEEHLGTGVARARTPAPRPSTTR